MIIVVGRTVTARLRRRERGESLERHLARSVTAAARLDEQAPRGTHRIDADGRSPAQIADEFLSITGWLASE